MESYLAEPEKKKGVASLRLESGWYLPLEFGPRKDCHLQRKGTTRGKCPEDRTWRRPRRVVRIMGSTLNGAFSGADTAIFEGLRSRGHLTGIVSGTLPRRVALHQLMRTMRPSRREWAKAWRHALVKSPMAFKARTAVLDRALRRSRTSFDAILHMGGLCAPFQGTYPRPVVLFCDYTSKLAEINYPPWFGLKPNEARQWYALETELYLSSALILTASEHTRQSFIQHFGVDPSRVVVVAEGVDCIHQHPGKTYEEETVLFVGIDFQRKGGPTLLEAFESVRLRRPKTKLWIVGPDTGPPQEGVTWFGQIGQEKLNSLYALATVFAMPSICEPFGLATIEAMSHGLPVVVTTIDAMDEIVEEGTTGILVPPRNAITLAERLVQLLADSTLARQMGTRGQLRVSNQFLWPQVIDRVEAALSQRLLPA
jgi:starch synthase